MADRIPAEVFPPGDFIKDELDARGWTQAVLAEVMGRPLQFVNELISGRKSVTAETAIGLGAAFGTSAELWLNLDSAYRLWLQREKNAKVGRRAEDVVKRGRLYTLAPVKEMVKRRWIEAADSADALENRLNEFYGVKVLEEEFSLPMAAKKSTSYGVTTPEQKAWVCRARHLARAVPAAKFDHNVFVKGLDDLHKLVTHDAAVRHVPRLLSDLGVRFVVVEHLPSSRIDGAAFWLANEQPVVVVSMRYDRIDNFWFTLSHELAHVLHRDDESLDDNLVGEGATPTDAKPEVEQRADTWACNYLVPADEIEKFVLRVRPYFSKAKINQFANRVKIHPGIIVGQLQRRWGMPYSHNREMLAKVRDVLIGSAMTDGWGTSPTIR